jgi:hypothetical protein
VLASTFAAILRSLDNHAWYSLELGLQYTKQAGNIQPGNIRVFVLFQQIYSLTQYIHTFSLNFKVSLVISLAAPFAIGQGSQTKSKNFHYLI